MTADMIRQIMEAFELTEEEAKAVAEQFVD